MESLLLPADDRSMSGVSLRLSRSRKTRDPSSLIQWTPSRAPSSPSDHSFCAYDQVAILSRSSSLPSSHPSTQLGSSFPQSVQNQQQCHNTNVTQGNKSSKKIQSPLLVERESSSTSSNGSVEVTIVQANGDRKSGKFVCDSKKLVSLPKQCDKVTGSRRFDGRPTSSSSRNAVETSSLSRSLSSPIDAGSRATKAAGFGVVTEDEKWAGPAYSKSPPPSSLPFPKFSVPSRSLSTEMTLNGTSAGSPLSEDAATTILTSPSPQASCNCWDAAFATKNLKRILNLDQQVTS